MAAKHTKNNLIIYFGNDNKNISNSYNFLRALAKTPRNYPYPNILSFFVESVVHNWETRIIKDLLPLRP